MQNVRLINNNKKLSFKKGGRKQLISLLWCALVGTLHAEPFLFTHFPALQPHINYISLCDLPTPIVQLEHFGECIGCHRLYIKRDDLTGKAVGHGLHLYGGNKPRKLEFLLADALHKGAKTVITYGCVGSNHALATAVYAHELGLKAMLMLKSQPNSYVVRHNLLLDQAYNAQLFFFNDNATRAAAVDDFVHHNTETYVIPTGGSNSIGALGFVNAAFELASQIKNNEIPEPDYIYVATGSCATTAGLLLGLKMAGIPSQVVAVCIEPANVDAIFTRIKQLFVSTNELLHGLDASVPLIAFPENDLIINQNMSGEQYGLYTAPIVEAIALFKDKENIKLDGTYSAKPVAALIEDACTGTITGNHTILFWNTYCGIDFSPRVNMYDYKKMPEPFHVYFQEEVQPLEKR